MIYLLRERHHRVAVVIHAPELKFITSMAYFKKRVGSTQVRRQRITNTALVDDAQTCKHTDESPEQLTMRKNSSPCEREELHSL
jgi:hypothetical protein